MTTEKISDSEWRIMRVIWANPKPGEPGITGNEIISVVQSETGWSPKTVRTLLSRLVEKGVLSAEKQGGILYYTAKYKQEEAVQVHGKSFLERVFDGNARDLLVHFLKDGDLSQTDADEIRTLLNEYTRKEKE